MATNGASTKRFPAQTVLLALGIVAPIYYVLINDLIAAGLYPGYDPISRPVSELSATYAPTRSLLLPLGLLFDLLIILFWIGVWRAAAANRALRITAGLMLGFRALALAAYAFPMASDEVLGPNTVHTVIWGVLTPLLMFGGIGVSAAAFGKAFRYYAIATLGALAAFGGLTGFLAAEVAAGETVRWFGVAERALIGAWLLWVVVLAIVLLRARRATAPRRPDRPTLPTSPASKEASAQGAPS